VQVVVKTTAPQWLFDAAALERVAYERVETDVGMTQRDSITIDLADTVRRAVEFHRHFDRRADAEARTLEAQNTALVIGDIPPLAHAAAARAGIRSIGVGNFTWDWIYEHYAEFRRDAPAVLEQIRASYALADRALRLPMHGGFATFKAVADVPLVARRSTRARDDTRRMLNVRADRPLVLASFGAYGVDVPFELVAEREGLTVLAPPSTLPAPLRYQDLVAAADLVGTKPGYGIVSECIANGTPMLYTSRGDFAEYDVFVAEMPRYLRCRFVPQEDFRLGRWRTHIDALLAQPDAPERIAMDGADVAAEMIVI
jgi:L-arabinokinase